MKNLLTIFLMLFCFIALSSLGVAQNQNANSNTSASSESKQTETVGPSNIRADLVKKVEEKHNEYASYTFRWSGAYWGFVFGAAVFTTIAGLWIKLEALKDKIFLKLTQTDIGAILAGVATLLITISTTGDFYGKWRANRSARDRSEQLQIKLDNNKLTADEAANELIKIIEDQSKGVIKDQ